MTIDCGQGILNNITFTCICNMGYGYDVIFADVERCYLNTMVFTLWGFITLLIGCVALSNSAASIITLIVKSKATNPVELQMSCLMFAIGLLQMIMALSYLTLSLYSSIVVFTATSISALFSGPYLGIQTNRILKSGISSTRRKEVYTRFTKFSIWFYIICPTVLVILTFPTIYYIKINDHKKATFWTDILLASVGVTLSISGFTSAYFAKLLSSSIKRSIKDTRNVVSHENDRMKDIGNILNKFAKLTALVAIVAIIGATWLLPLDLYFDYQFRIRSYLMMIGTLFGNTLLALLARTNYVDVMSHHHFSESENKLKQQNDSILTPGGKQSTRVVSNEFLLSSSS